MSQPIDTVESEALDLSRAERIRVVSRLPDSLDDRSTDDPRVADEAWIEEANRHYEAYVRGEEDTIPTEQVFAELRAEEN